MEAIYVVSTEEFAAINKYRMGRWSGNEQGLMNRYSTYLIKPKIYYFRIVNIAAEIELTIKNRLNKYRLKSDKDRLLEWVLIDLTDLIACIENTIQCFGQDISEIVNEDPILQDVLEFNSHYDISNLIVALPKRKIISTLINLETVVYYFDHNSQIYQQTNKAYICSYIQCIVKRFLNIKLKIHKKKKKHILKKLDSKKINSDSMKDTKKKLKKKKNKIIKIIEDYEEVLKNVGIISFMEYVFDCFIWDDQIFQNDFANKLDVRYDVFNFADGIYEFKSRTFRKRTETDYFTIHSNYNYGDGGYNLEIFDKFNILFLQVCNNDENISECYKSFLGYCMTGETCEEKSLWNIGEDTTLIKAFMHMADIYCLKLSNKIFDDTYPYNSRPKHLIRLRNKRMAYVEGITQSFDIPCFNDYVGSSKISCDELDTNDDLPIFFKLIFNVDNCPQFKPNEALKRRGLCIKHNNQFSEKDVYDKNSDEYKLALFHVLLPYCNRYYESKFTTVNMDSLYQTWTNLCFENNPISTFITNKYVITNNDNDRIYKKDLLKAYQEFSGLPDYSWLVFLNDCQRVGLKYDRFKRVNGNRGIFIGIKQVK